MNIRRATEADVPAIAAIYDAIHTREEAGLTTIGWKRGVYPTAETAMDSVQKGTMYVIEDDNGHVLSAAKIDQNQGEEYARARWKHATPPERVLVMHTLVVDPAHEGHGLGLSIVRDTVSRRGGDIWAENIPEGGTRFVVKLPCLERGEDRT